MEVLSTVNVQHLESIAPTVAAITGIKIRETVPDWVLEHANEIVMVDLTPEALQNRMRRGEVYHTGKVDQALKNFFRRGNLIALRELALRQVAEQVDRSLETYMDQKEIQDSWVVRERIAVCFSSNPRAQYLIARASRMARRMDAELFAIYVDIGVDTSEQDRNSLQANIQFSESLGAKVVKLTGKDVSSATAEFVREKHVTQVIFGRSAVEGWRKYLYMTAIHRFLRDAPAVDVHIVTQEPD
jgi:two-component system sensor histidine kinase KdpD